jgi:hypothetical protein
MAPINIRDADGPKGQSLLFRIIDFEAGLRDYGGSFVEKGARK